MTAVLVCLVVAVTSVAVHAILGWVRATQHASANRVYLDAFAVEQQRRIDAETSIDYMRQQRDQAVRSAEAARAQLAAWNETMDLVAPVREQAERLHGQVPEGMNG